MDSILDGYGVWVVIVNEAGVLDVVGVCGKFGLNGVNARSFYLEWAGEARENVKNTSTNGGDY